MNLFWKPVFVAIALLAASGCTLLARPRGSVTVYAPVLSAATAPAAGPDRESAWQIEVAEPLAPVSLLGTHILVSPQPGSVEIYRDARWQDPPAIALQTLLVQGLSEAGVAGVAGKPSLQRADFVFEADLLRLQADYAGALAPTATLRAYVRLIRAADGKVVAARLFAIDEPAAASPVPIVIEAFTRAIDRFVRDSCAWTVQAADAAWASPSAADPIAPSSDRKPDRRP